MQEKTGLPNALIQQAEWNRLAPRRQREDQTERKPETTFASVSSRIWS